MEVKFVLTGTNSILFHADDVMKADELAAWRKDSRNKNLSVKGDDRSPPWTWITYLHHDGTHVAVPHECLMKALCNAATQITLKKMTSFKALSQSGLVMLSEFLTFTNHGKQIAMSDIMALHDKPFVQHYESAKKMGFKLMVKRAALGQSRNVRVRAEFSDWQIEGVVAISDPAITLEVLRDMFEIAGKSVGLLDWRPSAKKGPGPHGTFTSALTPLREGSRRPA